MHHFPKMKSTAKRFLLSFMSPFLLLSLTLRFSTAHWLCGEVPCPTPTSDVYKTGTLTNCFTGYEEVSTSIVTCSSHCCLKQCAMISYDKCEYQLIANSCIHIF